MEIFVGKIQEISLTVGGFTSFFFLLELLFPLHFSHTLLSYCSILEILFKINHLIILPCNKNAYIKSCMYIF